MPWTCQICNTQNTAAAAPPAAAPLCFVTAKCKAKGPFACAWQPPPPVVAVLTSAEQAAALGYPTRYNSHTDAFPSKHKTSTMFVNNAQTRGISEDGSTHSGGRQGWKGYTRGATGWTYMGSYQWDLNFWAHRPNDAQVRFPNGGA